MEHASYSTQQVENIPSAHSYPDIRPVCVRVPAAVQREEVRGEVPPREHSVPVTVREGEESQLTPEEELSTIRAKDYHLDPDGTANRVHELIVKIRERRPSDRIVGNRYTIV